MITCRWNCMRCSDKVSQGQRDQQQTKARHPLRIHHCCRSSSRATRGSFLLCSGHRWTCRQGFCCFVTDYLSFNLAKSEKRKLCSTFRDAMQFWIDMLICKANTARKWTWDASKSRLREEGMHRFLSAAWHERCGHWCFGWHLYNSTQQYDESKAKIRSIVME